MAVPLLGAAGWAGAGRASAPAPVLRSRETLVGTAVDIVAEGPDAHHVSAAVDKAFARMRALESLLSRFDPQSVVSRIGDAAGIGPVAVPPDVMAVLLQAQQVHALTEGAFDATVGALKVWRFGPGEPYMPDAREVARQAGYVGTQDWVLDARAGTAFLKRQGMALDLGGIAKLPILEAGLQVLKEQGVQHAMVNGGGDVLTTGLLRGQPWRVGLRDPRVPSRLLGAVALQGDAVVASSGDYERCFFHAGQRLHHVLNPRTGWPTQGVHGVSLVARTVAEVNGLGAAMMVRGPANGRSLAERNPGLAVLMAQSDGTVWQSGEMVRRLTPV
jgi:thiamine biosynthesis lipoprotein